MKIIKTKLGYELRFFNFITNKNGRIIAKDGFKCKKCNRIIKGDFYKKGCSFDLYHPKCYKKSEIEIIIIDDILELTN